MTEVIVLDVGHGNGAIVRDGRRAIVVDAPLRDHLVDALKMEGVTQVDLALASHSDADHCGGFIGLLLDREISVGKIRVNPDALRRSKFWDDFKVALRDARERDGTEISLELTDQMADAAIGDAVLEVLYPPPELALGGVGSVGPEGQVITPNAMSAVVRVSVSGTPVVLLPGDLDRAGLDWLIEEGCDIRAGTLVFPHHGGVPEGASGDAAASRFAADLVDLAGPSTVLFSLGRGRHATPKPEIVRAILQLRPETHVACTQLSKHCSPDELLGDGHLAQRYAAGRSKGHCCLGTAVLSPATGLGYPTAVQHASVVEALPARLCRVDNADDSGS